MRYLVRNSNNHHHIFNVVFYGVIIIKLSSNHRDHAHIKESYTITTEKKRNLSTPKCCMIAHVKKAGSAKTKESNRHEEFLVCKIDIIIKMMT